MAGLTGLVCWAVCALITRAIRRATLKPYNALAAHLERLAEGEVDGPVDQRGSVPGVRRLARAVVALQQKPLAIHRPEAGPRFRYDSLYHDPSERRLLMEMLMSRRFDPDGDPSPLRSSGDAARAGFDNPRGLPQSRTPQNDGGLSSTRLSISPANSGLRQGAFKTGRPSRRSSSPPLDFAPHQALRARPDPPT
ncbi:hypothetical protein [Brevundimonas sp.]|uniref:hypothetical protein n=1 Tax=Brevundimonas sp. TaxID=1871086 RepID=UPI0027321618|nr:hypothetical protein [Brevundimonas sp.]MDP1911986.1 hypothetical protein [Brevundimonas sp.]